MRTLKALMLILLNISASNAMAEVNSNTRIMWFSSDTSSLLNRSSYELATKHIQRGIRLAEKALETELSPEDEFIAYYNLCMAYTLSSASLSSNVYCQHINPNQTYYFITTARGVLRIQRIHSVIDLAQIIKSAKPSN